ncbi:hypothetical protein RQP46_009079 [Phenoliferia psychrophenolica]
MSLADALQAHSTARDALIKQERALSFHHHEKPLSEKELAAIKIIETLREEELVSVWHLGREADPSTRWLGMPFTSSKQLMHKSKLFGLIKQMPKGAILHCHLDAMNDPHALLRLAFKHASLCIAATAPLSTPGAVISFKTLPKSDNHLDSSTTHVSLFSADYAPGTLVPVAVARPAYPGGPDAFDKFVVSKLVVTPDSVGWSPTEVWAHFGSTFMVTDGLLRYEPVWEAYIAEVFATCAEDSVPYLECRINFLHEFITSSATGVLDLPHRDWLRLFQRALDTVKAATAGTSRPFRGAKIIYSTIRFIEADCIALKKEFPDLIAAFDLVGWEDGLRPLSYYMEDLLWFKERCREEGVDIPYAFHAGETLTDGGKADMNLYDAILLDTKRIGHGFSLPQHPLLMDICKERNIAVECCPISNELLRYTASSSTHPLAVLLNSNVPVSLSCDDPQFFGNTGLSYDFYQVFTSSEQMDVVGLGRLARQSIEYSFMDKKEKSARLAEFDAQFDAFLDVVRSSV